MQDIPACLATINRLLKDSSEQHFYATFFFGVYDDVSRRLLYANCGHNPPVLLRASGAIERLGATATILGMFDVWQSTVVDTEIAPGDLLVLFTDGVPEAMSDSGDQFTDERLLEVIRNHCQEPPAALVDAIVSAVTEFSGSEQEDDITLVAARALNGKLFLG
jgi:sigma-B regulation protein RsbU (phosphoserine phosphatase)